MGISPRKKNQCSGRDRISRPCETVYPFCESKLKAANSYATRVCYFTVLGLAHWWGTRELHIASILDVCTSGQFILNCNLNIMRGTSFPGVGFDTGRIRPNDILRKEWLPLGLMDGAPMSATRGTLFYGGVTLYKKVSMPHCTQLGSLFHTSVVPWLNAMPKDSPTQRSNNVRTSTKLMA